MNIPWDRNELENLRGHLMQMGPDYSGASEVIRAFLTMRGYGVSPETAQRAAVAFGQQGCTLASIERVLADASWAN